MNISKIIKLEVRFIVKVANDVSKLISKI